MGWLTRLVRRSRADKQLDSELCFHLDQQIADYIASGLLPDEARRRARLEFGGLDQVKEQVHAAHRGHFLETLLQDIRYGLRMLRKSPGFTAVAIITLALGIGANTAIFSVVDAVLLRPLPYAHADRLVELAGNLTSIPIFNVLARQTHAFDAVTAYGLTSIDLTGPSLPEELRGMHASAGYFDVFSVPMTLGRWYTTKEDTPRGPNVAVISNALWNGQFGRDSHILARTIELGGEPYRIIGVTAPQFGDPAVEVWLPLRADPNSANQANYLSCVGLLNSGVTIAQARAAMKLAATEFKRKFPTVLTEPTFKAVPLKESMIRGVRKGLLLLFGAVAFVLLIACSNVANLLLARGALRNQEFSIRAALGAGRGRIIAQLLSENVLLSLTGGTLGLGVGYSSVKILLAASSIDIPRIGDQGSAVTVDWRVLLFTALIAVATGVLCGSIQALRASRTGDLNAGAKDARHSGALLRSQVRSVLGVAEIALALILMTGATLLIRTMSALHGVDPGFDARNVSLFSMTLPVPAFQRQRRFNAWNAKAEREFRQCRALKQRP